MQENEIKYYSTVQISFPPILTFSFSEESINFLINKSYSGISQLYEGRTLTESTEDIGLIQPKKTDLKEIKEIDLKLIQIEKYIEEIDALPLSYNQVLLKGILRYCSRLFIEVKNKKILSKGEEEFYEQITKLFDSIYDLLSQQKRDKVDLINLNLILFENKLDLLQEKASYLKTYPTIESFASIEDE